MRVLLAIGSSEIGGGQIVFLNCLRELRQRGCIIEVLLPEGPLVERVRAYDVKVHLVDFSSVRSLFAVARQLWCGRFDIVNAHLTKCSLMVALVNVVCRVPLCSTLHNAIIHEKLTPMQRRLYPALYCLIEKLTDGIIATSEQNRRHFLGVAGMKSGHVKVIYPGIDLARFTADRLPGIDHGRFVIGTVGRLSPEKGTIFLLEALRELRDVPYDCLIVGDGPCRGVLERYVQEHHLGAHVQFLGFQQNVTALMSRMDVVVMPSLNEAFGLTIIEAFAMGIPVIGSAVGGIPELLQDNDTGFLFPPRDTHALAEKLAFVYRNPDIAKRTALNALRLVQEKFTSVSMAERTLAYYKGLIREKTEDCHLSRI